jgi:lipoate-protein ligase A
VDLYNLGEITWWESQCFYHALAHLGREGLIICYPSSPYVCLGLHDDLEQEINREYCERSGIPVFRRETGGGVVYLDSKQVFFQLVMNKDNPRLPLRRHRYYESFLKPAIAVYQKFGIPAELKKPADLAANGRKCSGNACGDIGNGVAYVGNMLIDFNFDVMGHVLRVPFPGFRNHLMQAMKNNMTTVKEWAKHPVSCGELAVNLIDEFRKEWDDLIFTDPDQSLTDKTKELYDRYITEEWLQMPGRKYRDRKIKIAEGLMLMEKTTGTGCQAVILVREGIIEDMNIYGRQDLAIKYIGHEWKEDLLIELPANSVNKQEEIIHAS